METEIKRGFRDNCKLWYEDSYLGKIRHGVQKTYWQNGQIANLYYYNNGFCKCVFKRFLYDGKRINQLEQWSKTLRSGVRIEFNY